jgi:patatin-like phospholipase/acyl hydrolase
MQCTLTSHFRIDEMVQSTYLANTKNLFRKCVNNAVFMRKTFKILSDIIQNTTAAFGFYDTTFVIVCFAVR